MSSNIAESNILFFCARRSVCFYVEKYIRPPLLVNLIYPECCEGFYSNVAQMSSLTLGHCCLICSFDFLFKAIAQECLQRSKVKCQSSWGLMWTRLVEMKQNQTKASNHWLADLDLDLCQVRGHWDLKSCNHNISSQYVRSQQM